MKNAEYYLKKAGNSPQAVYGGDIRCLEEGV